MTENSKSQWVVDAGHSEVQFKVKHLMIANVSGIFKTFKGHVQTESEDFSNSKIVFEIDTNSLDTNQSERNGHLKSAMFLDTEKFPAITFEGVLQKHGDDYELGGDLTICAVTKSVTLEVEYTGTGNGRFGDIRAGFEVSGKINRKDFGLNFNVLTETGSLVVGEEVKLHFDVELIKQ